MRRAVLLLLFGLPLSRALPAVAAAQKAPTERQLPRDAYAAEIAEAAARFQLLATWVRAVLRIESAGDPRSTSPRGAMGLMQIMPQTWSELRVHYRLGDDPYDPHDNIIAGAAYMRKLLDHFGSPGFLAAYNAGPRRYEASLKGHPLPAETEAYVAALAPVIEGRAEPESVKVVATRSLSWSGSPLFVAQADGAFFADSGPSRRPSSAPRSAISVRDVSAIVPQSGGLFVARAAEGTVR